jgi:hypothetical protein
MISALQAGDTQPGMRRRAGMLVQRLPGSHDAPHDHQRGHLSRCEDGVALAG